ncbi:MAG: tetratricopeptide repeat protein [Chloroflexi bacterium]|nr:tetratricopeptide repeat protein [Chloroflexota bacterium]
MNMDYKALEHAPSVYIPMDRRHAIAQGILLSDWTTGTALFADISGFTPLTEALTRSMGPGRGAEELTRQLNQVYDALIIEVDRYGGSVIGFAGDAITCWFAELAQECENEEKKYAPLRATACALAMQQAMKQFAVVPLPFGETVLLAMKAAVASGPARRFLIGDPDIQLIDALAGETLARMAAGEHLADRGEVVVDAQTVTHLGRRGQVVEWRTDEKTSMRFAVVDGLTSSVEPSPWPVLSPQALQETQVRSWLLPTVYEWLREGLGEFLELKRGVTIFLHFAGIDYEGDGAAEAKLDAYIRWVQRVLTRYEGALLQLIIGDKGSYLYAAFGAPIAHEDDAQRAVMAALELRTPSMDLDFIHPVQIGISMGAVRAGTYGGMTRRTYGVLSDEVNLAARLMQNAALGEVLVSKRVQNATAAAFEWETLAPIRVKGKSEPIPVARLVGVTRIRDRTESAAYTGALVGRDTELTQLMQFLQPALENQFAGIAYVYGEAGVGKSRLLYELRQQNTGFKWIICPAEQILHQSLYPFRYFLRAYFNQHIDISAEENKKQFNEPLNALIADLREPNVSTQGEEIAQELERTRSFLGALVDLHWKGSLYEQLEPKLRFENTLASFKILVRAESKRQPVVVYVEDAHWLDADSHELLQVLMRNIGADAFAVLLAGRYQDDGSRFTVSVENNIPQQAIDLNELSPDGIRALTSQRLGGEIADNLGAFLAEKTNGNPLFVEQLALDMHERGLVRLEDEQWQLLEDGTEQVPASISAVLIARMDRLAARVKAAVQTAAVLGREFEVQILSRMLRGDTQLSHRIRQAEVELIWSALSEMHYIFRHTLMRDAAYDMQLQARLQRLHAMAGEAIELVYTLDLGPHYADLAYHWGKSTDTAREFRYAKLAGEHAAARFANQEAIGYFDQALQSATHLVSGETADQRQEIHISLGELLTTIGHYDQAQGHLDQALVLAAEHGDHDAQARACRRLARLNELRGDYPSAIDWIRQGLTTLGKRKTIEAAEMLITAGLIHTRQGDYDSALDQCQNALPIAQQLGKLTTMARAYVLSGHIGRLRGANETAIEHFQRALDLYQQVGDLSGQGMAHNQIGNAYFEVSRWSDADRAYKRARETFHQMGDVYNQSIADNNLGEIALYQGRLDEAVTYYQEALYAQEQIGASLYIVGILHNNLGATFVRRGDVQAALEDLHTSKALFEQAQSRDFLPELHRHFAEAALLTDDLVQAETEGTQALDLARELEMRGEEGISLRVMGEIALAQGRPDKAIKYLAESLAILAEMEDEYQQACTQFSIAKVHLSQGTQEQGLAALEHCIPVFQRLDATLDFGAAQALREELPNPST